MGQPHASLVHVEGHDLVIPLPLVKTCYERVGSELGHVRHRREVRFTPSTGGDSSGPARPGPEIYSL